MKKIFGMTVILLFLLATSRVLAVGEGDCRTPGGSACGTVCDPADASCLNSTCIWNGSSFRYYQGSVWKGECDTAKALRLFLVCTLPEGQGNKIDTVGLGEPDTLCGFVPTITPAGSNADITKIFGKVTAPVELNPFIQKGGAGGISSFLNNLIVLIYMVAAVVFVFMLLWGALQWLMSGGDKEAVAGARNRITHAIIGIILFAVAFAVIKAVGTFTGFTFFGRQNSSCPQREVYARNSAGICKHIFYPNADCTAVSEDADNSLCKP